MPKVSIIVPVYNVEKYLVRCLDSLVNQTLQDIEIVIVNDGSTDKSAQIIEEYIQKYPNMFLYASQNNSGQAVARNRALNMCTGEYIGFLDSDDFVKLDMFERMYNSAIENGSDYVACGYTDMMYDNNGEDYELEHYVASKVACETRDLFFGALASPFLHLYKREIVLNYGVRFPEGVIYEDTAFYINLIPHIKKLSVIEEPLAYRTRHLNSTMTTFKAEKVVQIFEVMDNIIKYYKDNNYYDNFYLELEYFCVRVLLCSSMGRIAKVENKDERNKLIQHTLEYIDNNFGDYRRNTYFARGMKNKYMKYFNSASAKLFISLIRFKGKLSKQYT